MEALNLTATTQLHEEVRVMPFFFFQPIVKTDGGLFSVQLYGADVCGTVKRSN